MSDSWCSGQPGPEATDAGPMSVITGAETGSNDPIARINGASFLGRWEAFAVALSEDRARRSAIEG